MPLQNRVTPFSRLEIASGRGMFMGNRGCLHGQNQHLRTQGWRNLAWITCQTEFKGRKRQLMKPGAYTELFFLDEAVAFAAGHRPCAECRREKFNRFRELFKVIHSLVELPRATAMDDILHAERLPGFERSQYPKVRLQHLPDGTMIRFEQTPSTAWLVYKDWILEWSHVGYQQKCPRDNQAIVEVITIPTFVEIFRLGYPLQYHKSIDFI